MQPKTRQELAWQYGYCTRTFVRMLQQHQLYLRPRVLISLKAQIRIYARLGIPPGLPEEEYKTVQQHVQDYCKRHDLEF